MTTLTELQDQRAGLVRRVASLTSQVRYGDRTVQYDLTQAETALRMLDREIEAAKAAAGGGGPRFVRLSGRSGY